MESMEFFVKFLLKDIEVRLKLLEEEFLHIESVINFFSLGGFSDSSSDSRKSMDKLCRPVENHKDSSSDTSLRKVMYRLCKPVKTYKGKLKEAKERYKKMKALIETYKDYNGYEFLYMYFSDYIRVHRILESIAEPMEFIQKKMVSLLESFPGYYPAPRETSIKEATKIHIFMEKLSEDFYKHILYIDRGKSSQDEGGFSAHFYWDFNKTIRFWAERDFVILNTDYNLPHRQFQWVILLHEILHYIVEEKDIEFKLSKLVREYSQTLSKAFNIGITRFLNRVKGFEEIEFFDIFIDALLAKALGAPYALASVPYLLFAEDESLERPKPARIWACRLKVILEYAGESELCKALRYGFERAYRVQKSFCFPVYSSKVYRLEELLFDVSMSITKKFLKNELVNRFIEEIRNAIKENTDYPFLSAYLNYVSTHTEIIADRELVKKERVLSEGRPLCILFNEINSFGRMESPLNKALWERPVYWFQFYRLRYDDKGFCDKFEALRDGLNFMYCFGPYTMLVFNGKHNEKFYKKEEDNKKRVESVLKKEEEEEKEEEKEKDKDKEKDKPIYFFKEDYSLTLYYPEEEPAWLNTKSLNSGILAWINFQTNKEKASKENLISLFEKLNQKYAIFTSFAWFDFCALIYLEPEDTLTLTDFLKNLKERILIGNGGILQRTETYIFIGKDCINKVKVSIPYIHLRVASPKLGSSKNIVETLKSDERVAKVASRFGIRDLVVSFKNKDMVFKDYLKLLFGKNGVKGIMCNENFSDVQAVLEVEW